LIETVVVTGVVGMMMVAVTGVFLNSLRARNMTRMVDLLSANGNRALDEIKKNLLNARSETVVCPAAGGIGSQLSLESTRDGQTTVISCTNGGQIASNSANLLGDQVRLSGCEEFVKCETGLLETVSAVTVRFVLGTGQLDGLVGDYATRTFETKVSLRN